MSDQAMTFTVGKDLVLCGTGRGCAACGQPLRTGEQVYYLAHLATPWKAEDDEDNSWSGYTWHVGCDEGSVAAGAFNPQWEMAGPGSFILPTDDIVTLHKA